MKPTRILITAAAALAAIFTAIVLTSCSATGDFAKEMAKKSTVAVKGEAWSFGIANGGFFGVYDVAAARAAKASGKRVVPAQ